VSFATSLPDVDPALWAQVTKHPFIEAVADGTLPEASFDLWIQQDYVFLQHLKGVVRVLARDASTVDAPGLLTAATMLGPEFELFRSHATKRGIDLGAAPIGSAEAYIACLDAAAGGGYAHGICAYYACERSLLEAWRYARELSEDDSPYRAWIENWSSSEFGAFVTWIGQRLDQAATADTDELIGVFQRTVRCAIAFWDAFVEV
jgi:thiaminase